MQRKPQPARPLKASSSKSYLKLHPIAIRRVQNIKHSRVNNADPFSGQIDSFLVGFIFIHEYKSDGNGCPRKRAAMVSRAPHISAVDKDKYYLYASSGIERTSPRLQTFRINRDSLV